MPLVRPCVLPCVVPDVSLSLVPDVCDRPVVKESESPREVPSVSEFDQPSDVPSEVEDELFWLKDDERLALK